MHCTGCGKLLDEGATRCSACGTASLPPPPPGTEPVAFRYEAAPSRWPTVLKLAGVAAAIAVIVVAIQPVLHRVNGEVDENAGPGGSATTVAVVDTLPPIGTDTAAAVAPPPVETTAPAVVVAGDPGTNVAGTTTQASCTARGSTDSQGNPIDFKPENTLDGDVGTAWRCGGNGAGVTITYNFPGPSNLSVVGADPGYDATDPHNGDDRFTQNRRISAAHWVCLAGDASVATVDQPFQDARGMQTVPATGFVGCTTVRFEIVSSTSPGSRDFVALSEVRLGPG